MQNSANLAVRSRNVIPVVRLRRHFLTDLESRTRCLTMNRQDHGPGITAGPTNPLPVELADPCAQSNSSRHGDLAALDFDFSFVWLIAIEHNP